MSDEERDEAGRLVSVVVDGQRFHRAPDEAMIATAARLAAASGMTPREALNGLVELSGLRAERDSLRGVVQAVRVKLAEPDKWHRYEPRELGEAFPADVVFDWRDDVLEILAAAADAPQPEPPTTDHDWDHYPPATTCRRCGAGYLSADADAFCPGPSPAVLPDRKASE